MRFARLLLTFTLTLAALLSAQISNVQPNVKAGKKIDGESLILSNDSITATWTIHQGLRWRSLTNRFTQANLDGFGDVFELVPREGGVVRSSEMHIIDTPVTEPMMTSTMDGGIVSAIAPEAARSETSSPS